MKLHTAWYTCEICGELHYKLPLYCKRRRMKSEEKRIRKEIQSACLIAEYGEEEDNLLNLIRQEKAKSFKEGYKLGIKTIKTLSDILKRKEK